MSWKSYLLGDILKRRRSVERISVNKIYKLVTIKLYHKGVTLRNEVQGDTIKSSMSAVRAGDFILSGIDARNGAFGIVPEELDGAVVTNDFWCLEPDSKIIDKEFLLYLTSTEFFDRICKQSSDGTTQRIRLQKDKFFNYKIDLPSLEQQRVILEKLRQIGVINLTLSSELTHQLTLVKKLRQQLLQDAVQGKLVEQNKRDEPASELLKKIRAEKAKLIAEGKLKKEKPLPPIKPEEIPFEIPENWVWCRLGEACIINPRNKADDNTDAAFIPMPMISQKYNEAPQFEIRKWSAIKSGFTHFSNDDVVVAKITPCFENSKAGIMKNLPNGIGAGTTELHVIRGNGFVISEFIYAFIKTPEFLANGERIMRGVAGQQRVPSEYFYETLIPLPPIPEQNRIVKRIEQLMQLCDELQYSIQQSKIENEKLLQGVLKDALKKEEVGV